MTDSASRIAIASALPEEIGALTERVEVDRTVSYGEHAVTMGTLDAVPVALLHTGTGQTRARTGVTALLEYQPVDVLIYVGVAGALDPSLNLEAVLVPEVVQNEEGEFAPAPDAGWRERVRTGVDASTGTLVTVDRVVTQPDEKRALWNALDQDAPAAIDMETFAVAHVADDRGIPYLSVRVVSDGADERLPDLLKDAQRDDGSIDRTRVMRDVVWSPTAVPTLMRMRQRVQSASKVLADVVVRGLRQPDAFP